MISARRRRFHSLPNIFAMRESGVDPSRKRTLHCSGRETEDHDNPSMRLIFASGGVSLRPPLMGQERTARLRAIPSCLSEKVPAGGGLRYVQRAATLRLSWVKRKSWPACGLWQLKQADRLALGLAVLSARKA